MDELSRRRVLRGAGVATLAGAGVVSGVRAQEKPDFGGHLDDANVVSVEDRRGESAVTVAVGAGDRGLAFAPTGLWIDPGTTVRFRWTGDGGGHNVRVDETPEGSDWSGSGEVVSDAGFTHEHTFTVEGVYEYYCQPHQQLGMLGAIAVGDEVPTVGGAPGETTEPGTTTTTASATETAAMAGGDGRTTTETEETPGFGVWAALAGVGVVAWRRLRRR